MLLSVCLTFFQLAQLGEWPEARQNAQLTGVQSVPGNMSEAPEVVASYDLGRGSATPMYIYTPSGERRALCLVAGSLYCYDNEGNELWNSHPKNINYSSVVRLMDLNGDGKLEALLKAGRPSEPYGAVVIVDLESGEAIWRYDVEPMSYSWNCYVGDYRPDSPSQEIIVVMMGYPPDEDFGYISLFDFDKDTSTPKERWRYDFDAYTCYPSLLQSDLDGDGAQEIAVETHSRMWMLDQNTGAVKDFVQWDVAPANVRSYGLVKFVDLNGDNRDDFLCIANFAQHHEVLLNKDGKLEKAWHYGWPESVTTGKVRSNWPEPPYAKIDDKDGLEIVVSMYNSENSNQWLMRIYDAVTGKMAYRIPGYVAIRLVDTQSDQGTLVLAHRSDDPTLTTIQGAALFRLGGGKVQKLWEGNGYQVPATGGSELAVVLNGHTKNLELGTDSKWALVDPIVKNVVKIIKIPPIPVPQNVGAAMPELLAANLTAAPGNELVLYRNPTAKVVNYSATSFDDVAEYSSSCPPVLADLDGDGLRELITIEVGPDKASKIVAHTPGRESKTLWTVTLPPTTREGLPQPRKAYMRSGYFTGAKNSDIYIWIGTPVVRSMVISGKDGHIVWERGEMKEAPERYYGPSVNLASTWDYDGDGAEDLVFTNPDYYCIASGKTGDLMVGPAFPPTVFNQASQGLYTLPAILDTGQSQPTVVLSSGHYFQGGMTLDAIPFWHKIPLTGVNRCATEGFMQDAQGKWFMGIPRQNGLFACVDTLDGELLWEMDLGGTGSNVIGGDVDGDGRQEFLVGTSHAQLVALGNAYEEQTTKPRVLWSLDLDGPVGHPILADLDGDGKSEIAVPNSNGYVHILSKAKVIDE